MVPAGIEPTTDGTRLRGKPGGRSASRSTARGAVRSGVVNRWVGTKLVVPAGIEPTTYRLGVVAMVTSKSNLRLTITIYYNLL